jgi:predicted outer membrane repeat protein
MNRAERRKQSRSKSNTRRTGVTYLAIAGLAGGSIGLATPAQATEILCNNLKTELEDARTTGGNIVANFSGTCAFSEGFIFNGETTITGPADRSLTLEFTNNDALFVTSANLNVSNLKFTETAEFGVNYFIYAVTPAPVLEPQIEIVPSSLVSSLSVAPNITVSNSTFSNADVKSAIYAEGNLTVEDSSFTNLTSNDLGAAIFATEALTVTDSTFESNSTEVDGGAIFANGEITVTDSTFESNSSEGVGGAIFAYGEITVTDSTFESNSSEVAGGAIVAVTEITVTDSTFRSNSTSDPNYTGLGGGAIYSEGSL